MGSASGELIAQPLTIGKNHAQLADTYGQWPAEIGRETPYV